MARLKHQRARDAHALAHAAGKLRGKSTREVLEAHEGDGMADPALDLSFVGAAAAQAEGDIVPHREPRKTRVFLEHDADAVGHFARYGLTFENYLAGGHRLQSGENFKQGCLAAPRRPDHRKELAARQLQVERAASADLALALAAGKRRG